MKFKANLNGRAYPFVQIDNPKEIPVFNHADPERVIGNITPLAAQSAAISIVPEIAHSPTDIDDCPRTMELVGHIDKYHWRSQKIWYKPRTWLKKPLKIIDEFDVMSATISRL